MDSHGDGRLAWLLREGTLFLDVSGGMDSVVAAHVALDMIRSMGIEARVVMIYAHTPLALDENLEYVRSLSRRLGVSLVIARPDEGLDAIVKHGWPSPMRRWCMYRWKLEPMIREARKYPIPHLHVIGVRKKESRRRMFMFSGRIPTDPWYYCLKHSRYCAYYWAPIIDWSKDDVRRYIEEKGVPRSPLWNSNGHSSHDCAICIAYAKEKDYAVLKARHPELWNRLIRAYRMMNEKRRRDRKLLAWGYTDLDKIAMMTSLEEYISLSRE